VVPVVHALAGRLVVFLDPNCRPAFIAEREAYAARILDLARSSTIVKVSTDDVEFMFPGRSPRASAAALLDAGADIVLLTLGGDGAMAVTHDQVVTVAPPRITVADTVGAGDTFGAAVLCWLDEQELLTVDAVRALDAAQLTAMLDFGVRAAAITCSRPGADPPRRHEL
jgi:fructokinase